MDESMISASEPESDGESSAEGGEEPLNDSEEEAAENEPQTKPQTDEFKPFGTSKNNKVWKKVEVDCNLINVKGGFNTKSLIAILKDRHTLC